MPFKLEQDGYDWLTNTIMEAAVQSAKENMSSVLGSIRYDSYKQW
jgi:hypothetical protein